MPPSGVVLEVGSATGRDARALEALGRRVERTDAVFLHFTPRQLRTALDHVRRALGAGGVLGFTVKEGYGSEWSEVGLGMPRFSQYWQPDALRSLVEEQGWQVVDVTVDTGSTWTWISVVATPAWRLA